MILQTHLQVNTKKMKKIFKSKATYQAIQLFGIIIFGIGALTLCGYMVDKPEMYTWQGNAGMALNSAVAFCFDGISFYIVGNFIKIIVTKL